jgi:hypothetical protein
MKWECIHSNSIIDRAKFTDFIKQSDNDKNSIQEAEYSTTVGVYYQTNLMPELQSKTNCVVFQVHSVFKRDRPGTPVK